MNWKRGKIDQGSSKKKAKDKPVSKDSIIMDLKERIEAITRDDGDRMFKRRSPAKDIVMVLRELPEPQAPDVIKLWIAELDIPPEEMKRLREEAFSESHT